MANIKSVSFTIVYFFLINITSCSVVGTNNSRNKIDLRFKPEERLHYKYNIYEIKEIEQEIGKGNRLNSVFESHIELIFQVKILHTNDYRIFVEFKLFHTNSLSDEDINKKMSGKEYKPNQKVGKEFQGALFSFDVDAKGEIKNLLGYEDFKKRFEMFGNADIDLNNVSDSKTGYLFNRQFFIDFFGRICGILPNRPMELDSSWLHKDSQEIGMPASSETKYTFSSIQDSIIHVKSDCVVSQQLSSFKHFILLSGNEEGQLDFDSQTGILLNSAKTSIISGQVKIGEVDVSMKVKRTSLIVAEKVD